jgi:F-type H+-transporting ATPase subunit b
VIVVLLVYFGRKPISDYFASRRQGIQAQISQAADLLSQAEHRNSELQRRLVDLSAELESIRESAGRRAEEEAMRILAEARATADRIRPRCTDRGGPGSAPRPGEAPRRGRRSLALELAARKLEAGVSDSDRDRLVDEFITRVQPGSAGGMTR